MVLRTARKIAVGVIGGTVVLLGIIMLVVPGPGILGILAGLAILATEFAVAAKLLKDLKQRVAQAGARVGLGSAARPHPHDTCPDPGTPEKQPYGVPPKPGGPPAKAEPHDARFRSGDIPGPTTRSAQSGSSTVSGQCAARPPEAP